MHVVAAAPTRDTSLPHRPTIQKQAAAAAASLPGVLAPLLQRSVTAHASLPEAAAALLASRVAGDGLSASALADALVPRLKGAEAALARDLLAVVETDPAAPDLLGVFLNFKGFHALAAHRAASALWAEEDDVGAKQLALLLQGRASAAFGVRRRRGSVSKREEVADESRRRRGRDIVASARKRRDDDAATLKTQVDVHPGATVGAGIFIDHASGVVIGEQAAVGDDCYILHGVTLGATGKVKHGRRHPHVGSGCTIGSGASVLGPISIGDGCTGGRGVNRSGQRRRRASWRRVAATPRLRRGLYAETSITPQVPSARTPS